MISSYDKSWNDIEAPARRKHRKELAKNVIMLCQIAKFIKIGN